MEYSELVVLLSIFSVIAWIPRIVYWCWTSSLFCHTSTNIIHQPPVPKSFRSVIEGVVSLSNGYFLIIKWHPFPEFYLFSSKTAVWSMVKFDMVIRTTNHCVKFGISEEISGECVQCWLYNMQDIYILELNYGTAEMTLKAQFSLNAEVIQCKTVNYVEGKFYFLFSDFGHIMFDPKYPKLEMFAVVNFNVIPYKYSSTLGRHRMIQSYGWTDENIWMGLYVWGENAWLSFDWRIPRLQYATAIFTQNGDYCILLGGTYVDDGSSNRRMFVVDFLHRECWPSAVTIRDVTNHTRYVLVHNSYQDELVMSYVLRMNSLPAHLARFMARYIGTEYLHILVGNKHAKIVVDDVLRKKNDI